MPKKRGIRLYIPTTGILKFRGREYMLSRYEGRTVRVVPDSTDPSLLWIHTAGVTDAARPREMAGRHA